MAGFNYNALMTSGGLSEQLGHLAGVIAGANATNRATDVASRRADIDQAFREAQLQHYKNMEERQGLTGAMNPLQQAAIREHEAKAGYYDHLTNKAALPKPPPASEIPFPVQGVSFPDPTVPAAPSAAPASFGPPHPGIQYPGENPDGSPSEPQVDAPPSMIRHIQNTIVGPKVADHLKNGGDAASAMQLQRSLLDQAMAPHYVLDPATHKYRTAPPPPHGDPSMGAPGVPPPGSGGSVESAPMPPSNGAPPAPAQGGPSPDVDAFGNDLSPMPAGPPMAPGGLGAAMSAPPPTPMSLPGGHHYGYDAMAAPAPAPAPQRNGKVIPASALKTKAAQLYGGDLNAAMAHAQALGYTIDQSR